MDIAFSTPWSGKSIIGGGNNGDSVADSGLELGSLISGVYGSVDARLLLVECWRLIAEFLVYKVGLCQPLFDVVSEDA